MKTVKAFSEYLYNQNQQFNKNIPSILRAHEFIDELLNFLFPIRANKEYTLSQTTQRLYELKLDFQKLITPLTDRLQQPIDEITRLFFDLIPGIYKNLLKDAQSFMDFDPAAKSVEGVIVYYPGFYSIMVYRLSHELYILNIPFLPRMIAEYAHSKTGIDIHPGANIGEHFLIDHGTGIVIGETSVIGSNVKIYQGVTLGAMCVDKNMECQKRHPTIEDNVVIYAGSTILGGDTIIGHDTIVGGNAWITKSIPPFSVVYNESKSIVRDGKNYVEPMNFVI